MNPLTSHKNHNHTANYLTVLLIIFSSFNLCACQAADGPEFEPFAIDPFSRYGFAVTGFTPTQETIILDTLEAFASALGSPAVLREIILAYNHGQLRSITYDPTFIAANSEIRLSPTVFSMDLAETSGFPCYAAANEDAHAQIVLGHEIGHILVNAAKAQTGVDWGETYAQRISRNWAWMAILQEPVSPNEEAVTELSLKALNAGYYFSLYTGEPESDPQIASEIDAWAEDFLAALKEL